MTIMKPPFSVQTVGLYGWLLFWCKRKNVCFTHSCVQLFPAIELWPRFPRFIKWKLKPGADPGIKNSRQSQSTWNLSVVHIWPVPTYKWAGVDKRCSWKQSSSSVKQNAGVYPRVWLPRFNTSMQRRRKMSQGWKVILNWNISWAVWGPEKWD